MGIRSSSPTSKRQYDKMSSQEEAWFPAEVIDRIAEILNVKPLDQFTKPDGSVIARAKTQLNT